MALPEIVPKDFFNVTFFEKLYNILYYVFIITFYEL